MGCRRAQRAPSPLWGGLGRGKATNATPSSPLVGSEAVAEGQRSTKSISAPGGPSAPALEGDGAPRGEADWHRELGEGVFSFNPRTLPLPQIGIASEKSSRDDG